MGLQSATEAKAPAAAAVPADDTPASGRLTRWQRLTGLLHELVEGVGFLLLHAAVNWMLFPDGELFGKVRGRVYSGLFGWGHGVGVDRFVNVRRPRSVRIGRYTRIRRHAVLIGPLAVGEHCWIGERSMIYPEAALGDRVALGPGVMIITEWHPIGAPHKRTAPLQRRPIRIGSGCTVNAGAMILAGCRVGDGAVIMGGAKVSRSVPPHAVVSGDPARIVHRLQADS